MIKLKNIMKEIRWNAQLPHKPYDSSNAYNFDSFDRILILVPHADDELIGCYHLLEKYKEKIVLFFCDYVGSNTTFENRKIRKDEFIECCKSRKLNYIIADSVKTDLKVFISNNRFDLVLLTPIIDWHHEHREINLLLYEILQDYSYSINLGWYQISVPVLQCNAFLTFNSDEKRKMEKCFHYHYPSQQNIPIERFNINRKIYSYDKAEYIENYYIFTFSEYVNIIKKYKKMDLEQFNELKFSINKLNILYEKCEKLYKYILGGKDNDKV